MNYDEFCTAWHQALSAAGIRPFPFPPTETVDLGHMSRTYEAYVGLGGTRRVEPFDVTAKLSWTWDALHCARTNTTEEDLLAELLGLERLHKDTEQPCLRVDVGLQATLPWDSPMSLPETDAWRRWVAEVIDRLAPLLPTEYAAKDAERLVLSWLGKPEARVQCAPDGQLFLTGVELSAWLGAGRPETGLRAGAGLRASTCRGSGTIPNASPTSRQTSNWLTWLNGSTRRWASGSGV